MNNIDSFSIKLPGEVSLSDTEQYILRSKHVGKPYRIMVAKPPSRLPRQDKYPVVYLLDANRGFGAATEIIRLLQDTQELPPLLLVGIGYIEQDLQTFANRRTQDFTPTEDPSYTKLWGLNTKGGGALNFLDFIQEELKPFIQSQYSVDTNHSSLLGASLAGLFGLYTLFVRGDVFDQYMIGSPVVSLWNKGVLWDYEERYTQAKLQGPKKIFLSVGELEDTECHQLDATQRRHLPQVNLVDDVCSMAAKLQAREGRNFKLDFHRFDGETHMSVLGPWLSRGLRSLFKSRSA